MAIALYRETVCTERSLDLLCSRSSQWGRSEYFQVSSCGRAERKRKLAWSLQGECHSSELLVPWLPKYTAISFLSYSFLFPSPLSFYLLFLLLKDLSLYLKARVTEIEGEREGVIFDSLIYSQDGCKGQHWTRERLGASFRSHMRMAGTQVLEL